MRCQKKIYSRQTKRYRKCQRLAKSGKHYCYQHSSSLRGGASSSSSFSCNAPSSSTNRVPFNFTCKNNGDQYIILKKNKYDTTYQATEPSGNTYKLAEKVSNAKFNAFNTKNIRFQIFYSWARANSGGSEISTNIKNFLEQFQSQMMEPTHKPRFVAKTGINKPVSIYPYLVYQDVSKAKLKNLADKVINLRPPLGRKSQVLFLFATKDERMNQDSWIKMREQIDYMSMISYGPKLIFIVTFYDTKKDSKTFRANRLWEMTQAKVIDIPMLKGEEEKLDKILGLIYGKFIWNDMSNYPFFKVKPN